MCRLLLRNCSPLKVALASNSSSLQALGACHQLCCSSNNFNNILLLTVRYGDSVGNTVKENFGIFPQIDIIRATVIVWRVRGEIIRSDLCNIVCNNCAQCSAYTYEQT